MSHDNISYVMTFDNICHMIICHMITYVIYRVTNLKLWTRSRSITIRTLQLLQDLSVGFTSVRKLVKLESIQFILDNHTVSNYNYNIIINY